MAVSKQRLLKDVIKLHEKFTKRSGKGYYKQQENRLINDCRSYALDKNINANFSANNFYAAE